jgi:hypothetical protein
MLQSATPLTKHEVTGARPALRPRVSTTQEMEHPSGKAIMKHAELSARSVEKIIRDASTLTLPASKRPKPANKLFAISIELA